MINVVKIAILASGTGTNAQQLFLKFPFTSDDIAIRLLVSNKKQAKVLSRAKNHNIPHASLTNNEIEQGYLLSLLKEYDIDFIVLAGFLRKIPMPIIEKYHNKIINIHPSLLPNYGGKGMYGDHVHRAVLESKDDQSGITIHLVNEEYDKGQIIFQKTCDVLEHDDVQSLSDKVHQLEHEYFGEVIKEYIKQNKY